MQVLDKPAILADPIRARLIWSGRTTLGSITLTRGLHVRGVRWIPERGVTRLEASSGFSYDWSKGPIWREYEIDGEPGDIHLR